MVNLSRFKARGLGILAAPAVALILAASVHAAVPSVINYQGRLLDNSPQQNPVDATVSVEFSIWDSATGGASLWSETASVEVVKGLFNVLLGSTTPIPPSVFTAGATRYLEIHVGGETLAPRQRIAATPFASVSAASDDAASLGGVGADAYQRRIALPCPAGFSINAVGADGTTTCIQGAQGPPGPPGPGLDTGAVSGKFTTTCSQPVSDAAASIPGRSAVSNLASDGSYLLSYLPTGSYSVTLRSLRNGVLLGTINGVAVSSGQTSDIGTTTLSTLDVDPNNCGACGDACSTNGIARDCSAGSCEVGVCTGGRADCNLNKRSDGCEVFVTSDPGNCGSCGRVCSGNHVTPACSAGQCAGTCFAGFADCDGNLQSNGCERNVGSDTENCGTCGAFCSSNHIVTSCQAGSCESGVCTAPWLDCNGNKRSDGCEINPSGDLNNCGACGHVCSGNHMNVTCITGQCGGTCAPLYGDCDSDPSNGCERSIDTDIFNCGNCNFQCSPNHVPVRSCSGGNCNGACEAGYADCNGNKGTDGCETNINTSNSNCGSCGHVCGAGTTCSSGVCS